MIIGKIRFSYLNAYEPRKTPSGVLKYSVCCLIPKADKKLVKDLLDAIGLAKERGTEMGKFTKAQAKGVRVPMRDGDAELKSGNRSGKEYEGMYFFNATSDNPPGVVGPNGKPLMDQADIFSGCWGFVDANFFPYNTGGNRGIGVGLNNIMLKHEDERLDGRQKAEDAFAEIAEEDVDNMK